jgi:hypothetical protein
MQSREQLINFIESNYNEFSNLECSEVIMFKKNEFSDQVIQYLKDAYRFDYKGICVYYYGRTRKVWVENMAS